MMREILPAPVTLDPEPPLPPVKGSRRRRRMVRTIQLGVGTMRDGFGDPILTRQMSTTDGLWQRGKEPPKGRLF